ncbi:BatD family protein [Litoribacter populi]|uniref:BatD family protein n=1 Tax=Litoribacter populi TaxID=2598460 RepID=UPI00117D38FA|nr:BatD family protein [Litoribacter populi]
MNITYLKPLLLFLISFYCLPLLGQDVRIELGPDEIGVNETFSVKIVISDEKIKSYDQFPEISGFQKQGISQSSSMNIVNGQMTSTNSVIQYYKPIRQGTYRVEPFTMTVNGHQARSEGKSVTVSDARQAQRRGRDPFDDFFGRDEEVEYVEVDDEAFFSMAVDKDEVYVGEGFNVSLAFYMAETNQAPFQFYEPGRQLEEIIRKIKPTNAWEENFNVTNIQPERVEINGKFWTRFRVYEATFYPFAEGQIELPQIGWQMIKYRIAKNPSFFGSNRQEDFKTFNSSAKNVKVKQLPPHPLRNEVSVGNFRLRENFSRKEADTGEGVTYTFGITGEGNINSIQPPRKYNLQKFNTYDPNVRQQINRGRGRVTGLKEYSYFMSINEPDEIHLKDHFEWIFFNTSLDRYDTLRPGAILAVSGESKTNQAISTNRLGGIYDLIEVEDNKLLNQRYKYYFSTFINILLVAAVILLAALIIRKK